MYAQVAALYILNRKIIARPRKGNETIWNFIDCWKMGLLTTYSWRTFFVCPKMLHYSRETKGREIIARKEKKREAIRNMYEGAGTSFSSVPQ